MSNFETQVLVLCVLIGIWSMYLAVVIDYVKDKQEERRRRRSAGASYAVERLAATGGQQHE